MNIRYDIQKIKSIMDNLCGLTGLSMGFQDLKNNYIYHRTKDTDAVCLKVQQTPDGRARCFCSDEELINRCAKEKRPISHICHAGLLDTAVPIFKNKNIVGFIIIGRVRVNGATSSCYEDSYDDEYIAKRYAMMSSMTDEQMSSLINLISHIIFENAIFIDFDDIIARALEYIDSNISSDLSIESLCNNLYVSRNYLYKSFHSYFGCTVNEYITDRRIRMASILLRESSESVTSIADQVGIPNYTYFSRLFKKKTGVSPIKYRKIP